MFNYDKGRWIARIVRMFRGRNVFRRPANSSYLVALTGAVMIFTPAGNVVLTPQAARRVAAQISGIADLAEGLKA